METVIYGLPATPTAYTLWVTPAKVAASHYQDVELGLQAGFCKPLSSASYARLQKADLIWSSHPNSTGSRLLAYLIH